MDPAVALPSLIGRRLGDFEVLERMAGGGFGDVFRARQLSLGRDAVIKVLSASGAHDETAAARFMREAQLASRLDHPYAAHIYAFGAEPDGLQWIAMEMVRGTSLSELLRAQGPLPLARFAPLFHSICQVVHAAHEQGIIHRDIKPANVMVVARTGSLMPKLLDFGIARLCSPEDDLEIEAAENRLESLLATAAAQQEERAETHDTVEDDRPPAPVDRDATAPLGDLEHKLHQVFGQRYAEIVSTPRDRSELSSGAVYVGSPMYMAPELWLGPRAAGPACDIYALGILAYQCLAGSPPFTGENVAEVARAHLVQPLPDLGARAPSALQAVLMRATAKRARERYSTALELSAAFQQACSVATAPAVTLRRPPPDLVAAVLARAPQPIAETLAAAEAAPRADDAHVRYVGLLRLLAQYAGVLGLAAWSRLGRPDPEDAIATHVRRLCRGALGADEWLELAAATTSEYFNIRDAFPLPELVDLFGPDASVPGRIRALLERHDRGASEIDAGVALPGLVDGVADVLRDVQELFEYELVVRAGRGFDRWTGARRKPRPIVDANVDVVDGAPVLLDRTRAPVVSLWPIAKTIAPSTGADPELFLLAGAGRYGARLLSMPNGFERQDPELAAWLEEAAGDYARDDTSGQPERAPYRGLAAFSVQDSEFFFGRERESEDLANHLRVRAFAAVVGPSGAGKSSFVQAGVLPLLSADWRAIVVRPGPAPYAALRERLAAAGMPGPDGNEPSVAWLERAAERRGENVMLVVDQAEELVTLCRDEAERAAFASLLASPHDDGRVRVVLTLRDDFLMRMSRLPGLGERLASGIQLLGTPSRADLRRILTEPARRLGYEFEDPALVEEMVGAVVDNPSALALLSFTAARLWELRDRQFHRLGRRVYTSLGGVGGALAQHAEDTIQKMAPDERQLVREAFRHLVTADGTRAVISKPELLELLGGGPHAANVIESLVSARLAVTSEAAGGGVNVEITHEALLESWPRLVAWRREDAENARLRDQLRASARQWDTRGRQRGLLWRGDVLVEYRLWRARYRGRLTELEEAFGAACLREHARSQRRRRGLLTSAFAVLAAAAVVLYIFADRARDSAAQATTKTIALLEEQGRRDLLDHRPLRAAAPLARAYALGGRQASLRLLLARSLASVEGQGAVMTGHTGFVRRGIFSADGTRVVTAGDDSTVRLWDAATGAQLASATVKGRPAIGASPDHAHVAFGGAGEVVLATTRDLRPVVTWKLAGGAQPTALAVSADGARVITGTDAGAVRVLARDGAQSAGAAHRAKIAVATVAADGRAWVTGSDDGRIWLARDGLPAVELAHGEKPISGLEFDPKTAILASASRDGTARLWSVATGAAIRDLVGHSMAIRALAFAPDGKTVATASEDGTVRLWSVAGASSPRVLAGHGGLVPTVRFDARGAQLVTGGADGTARVWDVATGTPLAALDAHRAEVWSTDFDATGDRVVSTSFDNTARVWTIPRTAKRLPTKPVGGGFKSAAFSATGDRIIAAGADGTARIYAATGEELAVLPGKKDALRAVALSPDGTRAVTGTESGASLLWDIDRRAVVATLEPSPGGTYVARFRPGANEVAVAGADGVIRVFDARSGAVIRRITGHEGPVWGLAYTADGALLASASDDVSARIWNAATGAPVRTLAPQSSEVNGIAFDPRGERVATVGTDGMLRVFRVRDGAPVGELRASHDILSTLAYSADGDRIATASFDRSVVVWDAATLRELARVQRHTDAVYAAVYQPGAERILSTGPDGSLWLTDVGLERRSPDTITRIVDAKR